MIRWFFNWAFNIYVSYDTDSIQPIYRDKANITCLLTYLFT